METDVVARARETSLRSDDADIKIFFLIFPFFFEPAEKEKEKSSAQKEKRPARMKTKSGEKAKLKSKGAAPCAIFADRISKTYHDEKI